MMKVMLLAETTAGVQAVYAIGKSGYGQVVTILTSLNSTVAECARRVGIEALPGHLVKDPAFALEVERREIDMIVSIDCLYLVDAKILSAPRVGSFNMHGGPLPEYAGLQPWSWALYHGARSFGVTLHWMTPEIDGGPIAAESRFDIEESEGALALATRCARLGVPLVVELLRTAVQAPGAIPSMPQDPTKRRYFGGTAPQGGLLDWTLPAARVVNFVRACDYAPFAPSRWGYPTTYMDGRRIGIAKARDTGTSADSPPATIETLADGAITVATADKLVRVELVWVDGRYLKPTEICGRANRFQVGP
jgi:methionyl-tRNA formyltransferase